MSRRRNKDDDPTSISIMEGAICYGGQPLGEGTFGRVYNGTYTSSGVEVCVKRLRHLRREPYTTTKRDGTNTTKEFSPHDCSITDRYNDLLLDHPFIIGTLGIDDIDGNEPYIIMPKYTTNGRDLLESKVKKTVFEDGEKSQAEQLAWFMIASEMILNVGDALVYLHDNGLPHLDVRLSNVLINVDTTKSLVEMLEDYHVVLADRGGAELAYLAGGIEEPISSLPEQTRECLTEAKTLGLKKPEVNPNIESKVRAEIIDIHQLAELARRLLSGEEASLLNLENLAKLKHSIYSEYMETNPFLWECPMKCIYSGLREKITQKNVDDGYNTSLRTFVDNFKQELQKYFIVVERSKIPEECKPKLGQYVNPKGGYFVMTPDRFVRIWYGLRKETLEPNDAEECKTITDYCVDNKSKKETNRKIKLSGGLEITIPEQHPSDNGYRERMHLEYKVIRESYNASIAERKSGLREKRGEKEALYKQLEKEIPTLKEEEDSFKELPEIV